ncbi:MAG: magnesium protoporphyrin IX methyltransferase, partial [Limibacillus sp.]
GHFDHVVAMDSLIHYRAADMTGMLTRLAERTRGSLIFTFAPRTPALTVKHPVGRAFPRGNRAPAIEPIAETKLRGLIEASPDLAGWRCARNHRITTGFYMSHAEELLPR